MHSASPSSLPMNASRIRALREEMNCTQRKFAALFGVTPRTVQAWEAGTPPQTHSRKLLVIAEALFDTSERVKGMK